MINMMLLIVISYNSLLVCFINFILNYNLCKIFFVDVFKYLLAQCKNAEQANFHTTDFST